MSKLIFLFFIFLKLNTIAQNYCIKGQVFDSDKNKLEYFNVQILNQDSSMIKGGAFVNGVFCIDKIKSIVFIMKISSLGFSNYYSCLKMQNKDTLDLGLIIMQNNILNEIVITGIIPKFKTENGTTIVNVQNTSLQDLGSAVDILSRAPGVVVDIATNDISLYNKKNTLVLIDGKEIRSSSELSLLNSENISTIEIIRNPSAAYDATVTSVVNIKTKKITKDLLNVSIRNSTGFNPNITNSTGININSKKNKFESFFSYNYYTGKYQDVKQTKLFKNDSLYSFQHDTSFNISNNHSIVLGLKCELNRKSNINLQYNSAFDKGDYKIESEKINYYSENIFNKFKNKNNGSLNNIYIGYENIIDTINSITIGVSYAEKKDKELNFLDNHYSNYTSYIKTNSLDNNKIFGSKIDYKTNLLNCNTFIGAKFGLIEKKEIFETIDTVTYKIWDNAKYQYKDKNIALYIEILKEIKKFSFILGVRAENMLKHGDISRLEDTTRIKYNNLDLFPHASINFVYNNKSINLSYAKQITHPRVSELNISRNYFDSLYYSVGNPNLKPSIQNIISLNLSLIKNLDLTIDYINTKNEITGLTKQEEGSNVIISTYQNYNLINNFDLILNYSIQKPKWTFDVSIGLSKYFSELNYYDNQLFNFNLNCNVDVKLFNKIYFSSDFTYNSASEYYNTFVSPVFYASSGLRAKFLDNSLKISLNFEDIFYTHYQQSITIYDNIKEEEKSRYAAYYGLHFSIKYIFNKYTEKYQEKSSNSEELNRL